MARQTAARATAARGARCGIAYSAFRRARRSSTPSNRQRMRARAISHFAASALAATWRAGSSVHGAVAFAGGYLLRQGRHLARQARYAHEKQLAHAACGRAAALAAAVAAGVAPARGWLNGAGCQRKHYLALSAGVIKCASSIRQPSACGGHRAAARIFWRRRPQRQPLELQAAPAISGKNEQALQRIACRASLGAVASKQAAASWWRLAAAAS